MSDVETRPAPPERSFPDHVVERATGRWSRLYYRETAIDFYGKRWLGLGASLLLVVIACGSLLVQQLHLGIEFEGGVSWDVPTEELSVDDLRQVLSDNGVDGNLARVQELTTDRTRYLKAQVTEQDDATREAIRLAVADAAGVDPDEVSVQSVSASWGDRITRQAVQALIVFVILVTIFIAIRFEWRMAVAATVAMLHDLVIAVGVYSVLQLLVTPATVIAFLTILGFSLYDTIVVFDKVRENRVAYSDSYLNVADAANVSMNQVLGRSLNTTVSSLLPILSLLIVGSWIYGAVQLREFALALLIGMLVGTYSSIFVATPLFVILSGRASELRDHATGIELRPLVIGAAPMSRRRSNRIRRGEVPTSGDTETPVDDAIADGEDDSDDSPTVAATGAGTRRTPSPRPTSDSPEKLLSHPPRPRKKKRR